jgi:hypothetical protein
MAAPSTCALCGRPLEDRRRRYCSTVCRDRARRERTETPSTASSEPAGGALEADEPDRRLWVMGAVLLLAALGIYLLSRR